MFIHKVKLKEPTTFKLRDGKEVIIILDNENGEYKLCIDTDDPQNFLLERKRNGRPLTTPTKT